MGKDKRGVERGQCMRCTCRCVEYIAHTSPGNQSCGYCECAPTQHKELSSSPAQALTQRKMCVAGPPSPSLSYPHQRKVLYRACSEYLEEVESDLYSKIPPNSDSGHGTSTEPSTPPAANMRFQGGGLYSSTPNLPFGIYSTHRHRGHNGRSHEVLHGTKEYYNMQAHGSHTCIYQQDHVQPQPSATYMHQQRYKEIRPSVIQQHSDSTQPEVERAYQQRYMYGGKSPTMEKHHVPNQQYGGHISHITGTEYGRRPPTPSLQERQGKQEEEFIPEKNIPHQHSDTYDSQGRNRCHNTLPTAGSAQSYASSQCYSPNISYTSPKGGNDIMAKMEHFNKKLTKLEDQQRELHNIVSGAIKLSVSETGKMASTKPLHMQANHSGSSRITSRVETSEQYLQQEAKPEGSISNVYVHVLDDSNSNNNGNKQAHRRQSSLDQHVDISEKYQGSNNLKSRPVLGEKQDYFRPNSDTEENNHPGTQSLMIQAVQPLARESLADFKGEKSLHHAVFTVGSIIPDHKSHQSLQQVVKLQDGDSDTSVTTLAMTGSEGPSHVNNLCVNDGHLTSVQNPCPSVQNPIPKEQVLPTSISDSESTNLKEYFSASGSEMEMDDVDDMQADCKRSTRQGFLVSDLKTQRQIHHPLSNIEGSEVSRRKDVPVSSSQVSRKHHTHVPVSSSWVSRRQSVLVSSSKSSGKQDEPVSDTSRIPDIPVSSSDMSRTQDESVFYVSSKASRKHVSFLNSEVSSRGQDMQGSSVHVSKRQHTPVSNSDQSTGKDVSVSKSEQLQEEDVSVQSSKTARQGLPVFSPEKEEKQGLLPSHSKMKREPILYLSGLEKREQMGKTMHTSPIEERNPRRDGTFHPTVHGKNIKIISNGTTARRDQFYTDGICFSQFPIKMGGNIHLKIVETKRFRGSMRVGFTSNNPEDMSVESLPAHSYPEVPQGFWIKPLHDKLAQQGYVVTYIVDSSGDVFYSINGEEKGLFFSGVDVSRELWAAVDIHGSTIAVQFTNDQIVSDAVNKNIHEGDQVMLQVETVETLQLLQEGHGGMQHDLEKAIGYTSTGVTIRIDDDEDVHVLYKKHNRVWCINPAALRKVGKVDPSVIIMEGDLVAIGNDLERIKALQKDHGEWVETMKRTLGKIGRVTKITHQGDLRLRVDGKTWTFNAQAVSKITMRKAPGVSTTCHKGLHYWKRGVAKVCTKCGECTANGADCGLQGSPFRSRGSPCGCREKTGGCADCGLCHTCAGETEEETDHKQSKMAKQLRMLKKHGTFGEGDDSDDEEVRAIAVGDKVRVTADAQTLPVLQREGGLEWHEDMLQVIGLDGRATKVTAKSVTVDFPYHGRWSLVPGCLTKVHEGLHHTTSLIHVTKKGAETYQRGELVRVIKDARQLKRIQGSHDGYSRDMAAALGKTGCVVSCKDGSVKVDVTGMSWWFHPSVLFRPVLKGRASLEGLHVKDGDIVRVDVDAETFKTNQLCHGGYVDRMEKSLEDFGVVHHIDIDGDAMVYYPDGTRWCINALSLGKVDPAECGQIDVSCVLEVGDWVKVEEDKDRIKRVQERTDSIRWQVGYYKAAGKVGQVRTTYPFNDVITVQIEGSGYPLNPKLLRRASAADLKEVFGSGDITNPGFTRGDLVKIAVDINKLRLLQDGHGGFVDNMEEILDHVGNVSFIDRDGDVYVRFSIRRLCFNPYSLTKVTPEEDTFQVGDLVLIESDQKRFQELQRPTKHGRYNPKMLPACGKVGRLQNVISHDRVRVKVLGRTWVLNPQLVTRMGNPGLGTGDWKSATICAPNKHDWSIGRCLVCVKCGECTHYGRLCPARGKPGRYPGSLCGCGNGHAGCDDCGTCRGCAGGIQIHEEIESDGQDGWQGDAMEKLGVGECQPTSREKAAAHKVISAALKKMSQAIELMKKSRDEQSTDVASIEAVLENDFLLPFTKYVSSTHKKLMGDHLANIDAARVLLDQYLKCVLAEDILERHNLRHVHIECLQLLRKLLIHCTNSSFEFCRTVGRCNLLATLLQDLSTFHKRTHDTTGPAIHSLVTILYNCARVPENQDYFLSSNVVSILTPYLRSKDEGIRITTLSCLAFIVEEDNLHFIRLNVDMTELIVSLLKDALDNPDHVTTRGGFQYPALQVTTIISVLVRNDENKQILVTNGVVDLLIKMIETGDDREKESALLCIRKLADSDLISGIIRREAKVKKLLLPMRGDRKLSKSVRDAVAMTVDVLENGPPQETNFKGQGSISTIKCTDLLVDTKSPLGGGGFGVVFKGYHRKWMMNVAVKTLRSLPREQKLRVIEALIEEANFMRRAQNAYRYIVPLYGVCVDKELTALVMDFMENGSVGDLMFRVKHVPWALRWRILHETILGMNFLHSLDPQIIHHDLKCQNILLDEDFHAKITDFGLSKYKNLASRSRGSTGCLTGTITHIPPENLADIHLKAGEKFDVYSFGIFIWEILTGKTPYENAQHSAHIQLCVMNGLRPDTKAIPKVGPNELDFFKQLMETCWHQFPAERPQFRELGERVQDVMQRTNVQVAEAVYAVRTALGKEEKYTQGNTTTFL